MPENIKEKAKKGSTRLKNFLFLFLLFSLFLSVKRNLGRIQEARKLLEEEEKKVSALREEKEDLVRRLNKVQSEEFIEKQLRDNLGMSREGEIVIILPEDDVVRSFAPKIDKEEASLPDPNWKKWLKLFI